MSAPLGNQFAKGHDGSRAGRRSAYQERQDSLWLWKTFNQERNLGELEKKIKEGKTYSPKDALLLRLMLGNERLLGEMMRKLFPDMSKIQMDMGGGGEFMELVEGARPELKAEFIRITRQIIEEAKKKDEEETSMKEIKQIENGGTN